MDRINIIEVCALYLPILFSAFCWHYFRPRIQIAGALLLSFLWSLIAVFFVNQIAFYFDWWQFSGSNFAYHGLPISIWLGWSITWGIAVPLIPLRGGAILFFALLLDIILMPLLEPLLFLKPGWLIGEVLALCLVIIPSVLVYNWTLLRKSVYLRVSIQGVIFFAIVGFFLPDLILTYFDKEAFEINQTSPWVWGIQFNLLFFWVVLGLSAVKEFIQHGGGTPTPFDPPGRLVRTGLYAYLSNPMQVSTIGGLLTYAWILDSWGMVAAAGMVVVYSLGVALPSEAADLEERYGRDWKIYSDRLKPFLPRWTAEQSLQGATIYFARNCALCRYLQARLYSMHPSCLDFQDAESYPTGSLNRLTYRQGTIEYEGVHAFARGLSHLNLAGAIIASFIQFPGISHTLQLIADAEMFGKTNSCDLASDAPNGEHLEGNQSSGGGTG